MNSLNEPLIENTSVSPWSTVMKYGLIGSVIMVVWTYITMSMGMSGDLSGGNLGLNMLLGLFSYVIYILAMVLAVKEHRDKKQQGFISLGKAMGVSYLTGLIIAIIGMIATLLYFFVINPDFYADIAADQGLSLPDSGDSSAMNLIMAGTLIVSFFVGCFTGAIAALIVSAVMKKERPYNPPVAQAPPRPQTSQTPPTPPSPPTPMQ